MVFSDNPAASGYETNQATRENSEESDDREQLSRLENGEDSFKAA